MNLNYYTILGVSHRSDAVVIRAAYKALMLKYHPDTNRSADAETKAKQINEAFATLNDPKLRAIYDAKIVARRSQKGGPRSGDSAGTAPPPPPPPQQRPEPTTPNAGSTQSTNGLRWIVVAVAVIVVIGVARNVSTSRPSTRPAFIDPTVSVPNAEIEVAGPVEPPQGFVIENAASAAEPQDPKTLPVLPVNFENIERAAQSFDGILDREGIAGARAYSARCHKEVEDSPSWAGADRCAAFDFAAAYADRSISRSMGWSPSTYFEFQNDNQADYYQVFGALSYIVEQRLQKIRNVAHPSVADEMILRMTAARERREQEETSLNSSSSRNESRSSSNESFESLL